MAECTWPSLPPTSSLRPQKQDDDYDGDDQDDRDDVDDDDSGVDDGDDDVEEMEREQRHYPWVHAHKFHTPFTFVKTLL